MDTENTINDIEPVTLVKDTTPSEWGLYSWKSKPIKHQPVYSDTEELSSVLKEIENAPKIVEIQDICDLQDNIKL